MTRVILDCYTDEPAGLGVPPFLGVYPRYLYGYLKEQSSEEIFYLTIDDLRLFVNYRNKKKETKVSEKTNIRVHNLTKNSADIRNILANAETIYIILGVHVPGKYLTGMPGTLKELNELFEKLNTIINVNAKKVLTGPVVYGTQLFGGKFFEKADLNNYQVADLNYSYKKIDELSIIGAEIVDQINDPKRDENKKGYKVIEIETGHGCSIGKCSFCTEPLKNKLEFRKKDGVINEIKELYKKGERHFRIGKQTCFYTYPDAVELLKDIRTECKDIKTLHIDNVNPVMVTTSKGIQISETIVKYCTPGNVAALGIESFDPEVIAENNLCTHPETAMNAIRSINSFGAKKGSNGMPMYLPGLNLIFGLCGESKRTHEHNMTMLKEIINSNLLLRRINIRQAVIMPGTKLEEKCGNKFLRKNKKYYWKWRNDIRQNIDYPMLQKLVPKGDVLKDCIAEIYDGKTTFLRQIGTYPLIIGVKKRLELRKFYNLKVVGHMLRSIVGEVV